MGSGGRNRQQQNYWNAQAQTQNAALTQEDPLETARKAQIQKVLDWENQPGHDVKDLPGMGDFIQIGQGALARANKARMGTGALGLSDPGSSGYASQLHEQSQNELGQQVGADLENARAGIIGEAHGSVLPYAQLATSRKQAQANNSAQMFGQWNQRQSKNWWDYLREGVQMGSQVAGAFM